ncbi:MAG: hypothetical protein C4337_09020, partial [Armatimonadota bacterium]
TDDTHTLARAMLTGGLRALLTCVDPSQVPASLVGWEYDERLLRELPTCADPCGENGEFHTFCYTAPCFRAPIPIRTGEVLERDGFVYVDVLPLPAPVEKYGGYMLQ